MDYLFAIPVKNELVYNHFGRSKEYCFISVSDNTITSKSRMIIPDSLHHSKIQEWLASHKVTHVFANGIGQQVIDNLNEKQIEVIWGVPEDKPEHLVRAYLDSKLVPGLNFCDH